MRPVRIIVSIIASVDEMLVQFVSQRLSERLGQPFTIDNQPSAGARIGAEAILNASPDGHTLGALAVTSPMRSSLLPDVPTVGEAVRGYETSGLQGLCA